MSNCNVNCHQVPMSPRKKSIKEWPNERVKEYLDRLYPGKLIEWVPVLDDSLYVYKTNNGSEFLEMDENEIRVMGVIEFLKRNGGSYESS